jgi:TonB family protein
VLDGTTGMNSEFRFSATWESPFALNDVFLVLCLEGANNKRRIFVHEVGRLESWTPRPVAVGVPGDRMFGSGAYQIHLFSGGLEVFSSEQPAGLREETLDRMIAKHLASTKDGNLKPLYAPAPAYPAALRQAGVKGRAVVKVNVDIRGEPRDPVVISATDPVFGEAALGAIHSWRFFPRVKDGYPVATEVSVPFNFAPPVAPGPG